MIINTFRDDLTNISAKKEALVNPQVIKTTWMNFDEKYAMKFAEYSNGAAALHHVKADPAHPWIAWSMIRVVMMWELKYNSGTDKYCW